MSYVRVVAFGFGLKCAGQSLKGTRVSRRASAGSTNSGRLATERPMPASPSVFSKSRRDCSRAIVRSPPELSVTARILTRTPVATRQSDCGLDQRDDGLDQAPGINRF